MWTNLLGEFQAHQDTCQWPHPDGKAGGVLEEGQRLPLLINTVSFLSSCHFLPGHHGLLTSYSLMSQSCISKMLVQGDSYLLVPWFLTSRFDPPSYPTAMTFLIFLSSICAGLKNRFLEFANGYDKPCNLS